MAIVQPQRDLPRRDKLVSARSEHAKPPSVANLHALVADLLDVVENLNEEIDELKKK